MQLNPFQERAVTTPGHCTILACPGSGKTRVLSSRAAHLIANNELGRLCAVTFTRDAANELLSRIIDSCGKENTRRLAVGTFHSLAMAQIKRSIKGRPPRLLSEGERTALLRRCWNEHASKHTFEEVVSAIDTAKARVAETVFNDITLQRVYLGYEAILESESVMDFSDILLRAVRGMQNGSVAPLPIKWLLVDESQDMDEVQMEWILMHGRSGVEVTLVGDDDQSLYSFRHALGYDGLQNVSFALNAVDLTLPVNYRCAPNILAHAAKLIGHNTNRAAKNITAHKTVPGEIQVQRLPTRSDENELIAQTIRKHKREEWAILGRTNALLDTVEIALTEAKVKYARSGGKSVWDHSIGSVFAGLLRSVNADSWTGIANTLAFCGVSAAWINGHSRGGAGGCLERLDRAIADASDERQTKAVVALREGLASWREQLAKGRTSLVIHAVAGLLQRYCKPNQADLLEKLKKSFAENMQGTLGQRLAAIDLGSGSDKEAKKGVVQMLTLHSSKGLEFDNVWIMGCEEGNLPHTDSTEEDERRLMYVGMTRARSRLIMSSALAEGMESRFLEEAGL